MKIGDMQKTGDMHETMRRLYQAADELMGWKGQSEVAHRLNQSPQALNNWEARGMSKGGMLNAERVLGCSAVWLETGHGKMVGQNIPNPSEITSEQSEISALWALLIPAERDELLTQIRRRAAHNKAVMALMKGGKIADTPKPLGGRSFFNKHEISNELNERRLSAARERRQLAQKMEIERRIKNRREDE